MKVSDDAIKLIKHFEGLKTTAYICDAGKLTIGYGHTEGVKQGQTISEEQAEVYLQSDISNFENKLIKALNADEIEVTQSQFDALIAFAFNLGTGNLLSSTLWKKLKAGDTAGASDQFTSWIYVTHQVKLVSGRKVTIREPLRGLCARRYSEKALFDNYPTYYSFNNVKVTQKVVDELKRQIITTADSEIQQYYLNLLTKYQKDLT